MQKLFPIKRLKTIVVLPFILLIFLLTGGCGNALDVSSEALEGIWVVQNATRDNKPTTTLTKGYFSFGSDKKIRTNILGSGDPISYSLSKNSISFSNPANAQLKVVDLNDSTMVMESKIKGKDFRFELSKVDSLPNPE